MNDKHESMNAIMKLYELRREETMREARRWYADFSPETFQDIIATVTGEKDPYFRMFTTYWDMAAAFVNHGAIDEQLFNEVNVEHIFAYAKVEPFLNELRELTKIPDLLGNLEKLVTRIPNIRETTADIRARAKAKNAAHLEAAAAAKSA